MFHQGLRLATCCLCVRDPDGSLCRKGKSGSNFTKIRIKFVFSIFLTMFDFSSLQFEFCATLPLSGCKIFLFSKRFHLYKGRRPSLVKKDETKTFSISGSLGLAVLSFLPARGTLCQRGGLNHFWLQPSHYGKAN
jgi:hypothetical protein